MQYDLKEIYLDWISRVVGNVYNGKTFNKLFRLLNSISFTYDIFSDRNRALDGVYFRYRFGYENGYSEEDISVFIDDHPCTILEMMAALAFRCEESIMSDPKYEDRTSVWFWDMIKSLGLLNMSDDEFNEFYARNAIYLFLNHSYKRNGRGGLFTVKSKDIDMRKMDIWYQLNSYLIEIDERLQNSH